MVGREATHTSTQTQAEHTTTTTTAEDTPDTAEKPEKTPPHPGKWEKFGERGVGKFRFRMWKAGFDPVMEADTEPA